MCIYIHAVVYTYIYTYNVYISIYNFVSVLFIEARSCAHGAYRLKSIEAASAMLGDAISWAMPVEIAGRYTQSPLRQDIANACAFSPSYTPLCVT